MGLGEGADSQMLPALGSHFKGLGLRASCSPLGDL